MHTDLVIHGKIDEFSAIDRGKENDPVLPYEESTLKKRPFTDVIPEEHLVSYCELLNADSQ